MNNTTNRGIPTSRIEAVHTRVPGRVRLSIDSLYSSSWQKNFIGDATRWVAENTSADASVVSNEGYIGYFSNRQFDWQAMQDKRYVLESVVSRPRLWRDADYLVMYIKEPNEPLWRQFLSDNGLGELRSFSGRRGRVSIVAIKSATGSSPATTIE
jgi:hypothetical protein